MQLIQPNNKEISSKNIRNKLRAQSCKGRALRDSKFVSERQTNKHRQEIKTNIPLTQVRKYIKNLPIYYLETLPKSPLTHPLPG